MHQVFRVLSIAQKEHQVGPQSEKIDLHPQNLCANQLLEALEDRKGFEMFNFNRPDFT